MQMPIVGARWRRPFVGAPVARNLTPLSLTGFTNSIQYARTAPHVYPVHPNPLLDSDDHYDPVRIFHNVIDYTGDATWQTQLNSALLRVRDESYLATGGLSKGYDAWCTGVRIDYEYTGSTSSRNASLLVSLNGAYNADSVNLTNFIAYDLSREVAFSIDNHLEQERLGLAHSSTLTTRVTRSKGHIDQWTALPGFRNWGMAVRPFMVSLTCEALIAYWDVYRDSTIPPMIKTAIDWIWDNMYVSASKTMNYTDVDTSVTLVPINCSVSDVSPTSSLFKAVGDTTTLSSQDNYYVYSPATFTNGSLNGQSAIITGYVGATKQFIFGPNGPYLGASPSPTIFSGSPSNGDHFTISSGAYNTGGVILAPDLNLLIAPIYSWYYQYSKDPTYRTKHDLLFQGSSASLGAISTQKIYNQSYRLGFQGLKWRSQGDTAWPAATTYTLTAPSPSSGLSGVVSQLFTLALSGGNVSTSSPVVVTPSDGGSGTFFPATAVLTTDRPSVTFRYRPDLADSGIKTISITNNGGLSDPVSVSYTITGPGTVATGFTVLGTTTCTSSQTMTLQYALVPSGANAMPSSADIYAGVCNITESLTGSAGGTVQITTANPIGYSLTYIMLAGDTPTFDFVYDPATVGIETLHISSVGLTTPGNVTLTVTGVNPQFGFQIIIGTYNPAFNTE